MNNKIEKENESSEYSNHEEEVSANFTSTFVFLSLSSCAVVQKAPGEMLVSVNE